MNILSGWNVMAEVEPAHLCPVLIYCITGTQKVRAWDRGKRVWLDEGCLSEDIAFCWMPLPEPPVKNIEILEGLTVNKNKKRECLLV